MSLIPISSEALFATQNISLIATDMDGTLTTHGKFTSSLIKTLENDETLFDQSVFPFSVGVANVLDYRDKLKCLPTYVTSLPEGEGFKELAKLVLSHTNSL